ncbi:MAG TPA: type IV toxin-antitoxin system AbiEi family antitoxin domain-containing protein [Pseudonocardiaceae bacterium]
MDRLNRLNSRLFAQSCVRNPTHIRHTWVGFRPLRTLGEGGTAMTEPSIPMPATFTADEAERAGLSRRALRRMLDSGKVERIGHGLYRRMDAELVDTDLIEVAVKAPRATLCLLSALAKHDLTDIIPVAHDLAVPRGVWRPATAAPVHWHQFDPDTFDIGRTELRVDDEHVVGLYDAPRSIIDAFRLRHDIGADVAHETLRRWLRRGGSPADLMRLTRAFPKAHGAVLAALQVLV